jgi:hypothetical protein
LFSAQAVQRVGCGSVNLFHDDFRRIAMPLVLVLVLISIVVLLEAEGARKPASASLLR